MSETRLPLPAFFRAPPGGSRSIEAGPAGDVAADLAVLALRLCRAEGVLVTEPEGDGERLVSWAGAGHPEASSWSLAGCEPLRQRVYGEGQPWLAGDPSPEALEASGLPRAVAHAAAALPLFGETGAVVGCLRLLTRDPDPGTAEDSALLDELCKVGGALLHLRRSLGDARRQLVAMDSIVDGYMVLDRGWRVQDVSPGLEMLLGRAGAQLVGHELWEEYADAAESPFASHCQRAASRRGPSEFESFSPLMDRWVEVFVLPAPDRLTFYFRDISKRKEEEERTLRTAHRDPLTGLATRTQLVEWLTRALGRANRRPDFAFALLFLDLDRLKIVNDTLGHLVGDEVLRTIGRRLEESVRPGDSVARYGGDEFAILLYNVQGLDDATRITGRIQRTLRAPIVVDGREIRTTASVGIAISTSGYAEGDEMIHHADLALYRAKLLGRERYEVFDDAMRENAAALQRTKRELHEAIGAGQLRLDLDPVVPVEGGAPAWLETRLAWAHPRRGRLDAAEFLAVAEDSSLILEVGVWMLQATCELLARRSDGEPPLLLRLSARQLLSPDLLETVASALAEAGITGERLFVSIPAEVLVEHPEAATEVARGLSRLGTPLLLHGFGSGLVSLAQLSRLTLRAVVLDIAPRGPRRPALDAERELPYAVALAKALALPVAAAGIAAPAELARVRELGVDFAGGAAVAPRLSLDDSAGQPSA